MSARMDLYGFRIHRIHVKWYSLHIPLVACLVKNVNSLPYMYAKGFEAYVSLDVFCCCSNCWTCMIYVSF